MNIVLSIVILTAGALIAGAFVFWRRTGQAKQPILMLILALIAIANVAIWTLPTSDGESPVDKVAED